MECSGGLSNHAQLVSNQSLWNASVCVFIGVCLLLGLLLLSLTLLLLLLTVLLVLPGLMFR